MTWEWVVLIAVLLSFAYALGHKLDEIKSRPKQDALHELRLDLHQLRTGMQGNQDVLASHFASTQAVIKRLDDIERETSETRKVVSQASMAQSLLPRSMRG